MEDRNYGAACPSWIVNPQEKNISLPLLMRSVWNLPAGLHPNSVNLNSETIIRKYSANPTAWTVRDSNSGRGKRFYLL